jgi:hypothetical protein
MSLVRTQQLTPSSLEESAGLWCALGCGRKATCPGKNFAHRSAASSTRYPRTVRIGSPQKLEDCT